MKAASTLKRVVLIGLLLVIISLGSLFVYYLVFLHFVRIPSGSMANTIIPGDYLMVKKRAFGAINRGDLKTRSYGRNLWT
jgi:signal peptidase I